MISKFNLPSQKKVHYLKKPSHKQPDHVQGIEINRSVIDNPLTIAWLM